MKRILHATDYSENAVPALKYAFNLSEKLNASLFVVHVFDYPTIFSKELKEPYENLEEKSYKTHHDMLVDFCTKHYEGDIDEVDLSFDAIEDKSIVNGIMKKANNLNADLIITGTKSEKVLKELLLGNTAKKLIEKAPCPVLTVPKVQNVKNLDTIVYASDFEKYDISAIYNLVSIAKPFNATIKIVHISLKEDDEEIRKMEWFTELLNEKIEYDNIDVEIIFSDNIFDALSSYLEDKNADMVAMLERNSKGIMNMLFHIDLVKKMETLGNVPLMSFNENRL
ncbi:universal stress protein [Polaribacter sp. Hel1_85]|uniref:universal stress protein n=1 Tax=Polaribacter sp. Hel1_85 TaxID=1250005 RepID=UPI00052BD522|nr:universal stress protein [Polaribacter sp. Hel1_85]KGL62101.1 putative nucleotide-binding protein [Polaribacter sp. Hel1_85]